MTKTLPFFFKVKLSSNPRHRQVLFSSSFSTLPSTALLPPCSVEKPTPVSSSSGNERSGTQMGFDPNVCSGIGRAVISRCSHAWDEKGEAFAEGSSLLDLVKLSIHLSPETMRRFWRVPVLKPNDVLEILVGFGDVREPEKVRFLWKLFRWAGKQRGDFQNLPRSYEIMIPILVRARMLGEAETLLQEMEANRLLLSDHNDLFGEVIQGCAEACELGNSITLYDRARGRGFVPTVPCYQALINCLVKLEKAELAVRVYSDMIDVELVSGYEAQALDFVIGSLCKRRKVLQAANLLRRGKSLGVEPSCKALNLISETYCEKRDFEDLLNFLKEWKHVPDACVCNKIISSLCRNLGSKEAWLFVQNMEVLGFKPDAKTFGILISWCCKEGNTRNALMYLSELLSRSLKPDVHAYNALISGVFKEGMWKYAKEVFADMVEGGTSPDTSTFRVLLAGYCRERKFEEATVIFGEMVNCGMVSISPTEDALSKIFAVLGLDCLGVKVKRDNDARFPKAEFFDSLGNGLYLDADLETYEKILTGILDASMVPDFDLVLLEMCGKGKIEIALKMKYEVLQHGQTLSLSAYSELLKGLTASRSHIKEAINLLEEMPELCNQLDHHTLNLLVRALSKNGITVKAKVILDVLVQSKVLVEVETYTALIMGFCKGSDLNGFRECWELAQRYKWFPASKDIESLLSCLCKWGMLKEAFELFDGMLEKYPHLISAICNALLKELCIAGFMSAGSIFLEEVLQRGLALEQPAYEHLIKGFFKKKFTEALGILDVMLEKNIIPSASLCELLIPLLFRSNRMEKALALKQVMLSKQSEASISVYKVLLSGLCRIGKIEEATFQLKEMLVGRLQPDKDILGVMIQGYCQENNFRQARELLCIVLKMNMDLCISTYRSLVRLACMQGRLRVALSLKEVMRRVSEFLPVTLYNILMFHLFHTGNSSLVDVVLDEMRQKHISLDQVSYNFLVYGYYKCGDISKSVETLNTMMSNDLQPNNRSFRTVICYLCSHDGLNEALELSKAMRYRDWKHGSVVQNTLLEGVLSYGRLQEAELLLGRLEEKDLLFNNINYEILIKCWCRLGRLNKAVYLINLMLKKGSLPSEISYKLVLQGLLIDKAFDQALDFHAEMLHKNLQPSMESCDALLLGLCASGRTDDAERLLKVILQSGQVPSSNMFCGIIDRYHAENNMPKALEVLHKMQQNGYSPNFETHWSLISNLNNSNKKDDGRGKGFLSHLLSQSGFPSKDSKVIGANSKFKSVFLP